MARTTWLRHFVLQRHVLALAIAALGFSLGGNSTTRAAEAPQAVPAYHLEVGQELKYKQDIDSKRGEGKAGSSYSMHTDWTASVVAKNSDGSYRVLLRSAQSYKFDGKSAGRSHDSLGYCDVFPDGRVITNPTTGFSMDPTSLFPKLAENAKELAAGWQTVHGQDDARCSFKVESPPKSAAGELTIAETSKTPLDEIYLVNRKTTIDFDAHRGLMTKLAARQRRTGAARASRTARCRWSRSKNTTPSGARNSGPMPIVTSGPTAPTTTRSRRRPRARKTARICSTKRRPF